MAKIKSAIIITSNENGTIHIGNLKTNWKVGQIVKNQFVKEFQSQDKISRQLGYAPIKNPLFGVTAFQVLKTSVVIENCMLDDEDIHFVSRSEIVVKPLV